MTSGQCDRRAFLGGAMAHQYATGGAATHQSTGCTDSHPCSQHSSGAIAEAMAEEVSATTGQSIQIDPLPPETVEFTLREDARTGTNEIDGAIVPMWHIGGFIADEIIRPLDEIPAAGYFDFTVEFPAVSQLRSWGTEQMAVPIDGDCQLLYFQRDVFESESFNAEYRQIRGKHSNPQKM